ncbi:hypothetical protein OIV83_000736 [Microbotryomycetes sp. JL201]|nr:hypothetical protein OIV83_000736 [Microbotryomycetes sp. JL201]
MANVPVLPWLDFLIESGEGTVAAPVRPDMADDPLSDALLSAGASSNSESSSDNRTGAFASPTLAWAQSRPSDDLFAQPFQSDAWARQERVDRQPSPSTTIPSSADNEPTEDSSSSVSSSSRPITMVRAPSSSLSRQRSPSTSAVEEGHEGTLSSSFTASITPRGAHGFPFSSVTTPTGPNHSPDLAVTPSSNKFLERRAVYVNDETDHSSAEECQYVPRDAQDRKKMIVAACTSGNLRKLRKLLTPLDSNDSDVFLLANQPVTRTNLTPLHLAAGRGYLTMVEFLTSEVGAMAEVEDDEGETALHKAAYRGHLNVCQFLVEQAVSVNAVDRDGWSALHNAASRGWLDIGRLLVDAGARVDAPSKHRYTPLMNAASKGHLPFVNFLLKRGANPTFRNAFDETAFDLAASVFELAVCNVLSLAERDAIGNDNYNAVAFHSTYPVVVHENQRLARTRNISHLGSDSRAKWTAQALSRNDGRTAFTLLSVPETDEHDLPILTAEIGLPIVGNEDHLILPPRRQARSAGKIGKVAEGAAQMPGGSPFASRAASPSTLAIPSGSSMPRPEQPAMSDARSETAWFWLSDWTIDLTDPRSSPVDGWSYAGSFDADSSEWVSGPPEELEMLFRGDLSTSLDGRKWVRRRRWVRVMRRRLDVPNWGFGDQSDREKRSDATTSQEVQASLDDYRARARYLAGLSSRRAVSSDQASIRSGKTIALESHDSTEMDTAELRKAAARLERAVDELRAGILSGDDANVKSEAERELGEYLHQLAALRSELDQDRTHDKSCDGRDSTSAGSLLSSGRRPSSVLSGLSSRSTSGASISTEDDHFTRPGTSTSAQYNLAPHLSHASEFRVPTNDAPLTPRATLVDQQSTFEIRASAASWEADDAAKACRRCGLLVCSYCSAHADVIDAAELVHEPGTSPLDDLWTQHTRYRTCDLCHAALNGLLYSSTRPARLSPDELLARTTSTFAALSASDTIRTPFGTTDVATTESDSPSETGASDTSELTECPVCGENLLLLADRDAQETHVRECLETGGGTIAQNGRFLTFKLAPGPLVGKECSICFDEFEVDEKLARLACLCYFHATCIKAWLERGKSCPLHAVRDLV